jgi:hypothetical protein
MHRWRNPLVGLVRNHGGKSISNTDLIYSLNPHYATKMKTGMKRQHVDVEFGFHSHFRNADLTTNTIMEFPIYMLKVDIEYFMYLVRNYKLFA